MKKVSFEVQGSAPEPYTVTFIKRTENNLSAYCSCPAGENGLHCKHRINILMGETKGIVSDNLGDVSIVQAWVPGTDIEEKLLKALRLESEFNRIKKELSTAKKELAQAMLD